VHALPLVEGGGGGASVIDTVLMRAQLVDSMARILSARESSEDWSPKRTLWRSGDGERDTSWVE